MRSLSEIVEALNAGGYEDSDIPDNLKELLTALRLATGNGEILERHRALVTVEDGLAVGVAGPGVDLIIVDYDTDGMTEEETEIVSIGGEGVRYFRGTVAAWDDKAEELWKAIEPTEPRP